MHNLLQHEHLIKKCPGVVHDQLFKIRFAQKGALLPELIECILPRFFIVCFGAHSGKRKETTALVAAKLEPNKIARVITINCYWLL